MEARLIRATLIVAWLASFGAGYRTKNFVVDAPSPELAREIGDAAERYRRDLALDWLGKEMPQWAQPCMLTAQVAPHLGAGGATSFVFDRGEVFGWRMTIQGSRERILDSVLPHEVTHTIFACHFRQAMPRWADEGACTTVEHESERAKQQRMLIAFLKTGRGISFSKMFRMKEYPPDVMPLYSQGYSLARYLIAHGGKQKFLDFLARGMQDEDWVAAVEEYYGYASMHALQNTWLDWVRQGSPQIDPTTVASASPAPHAQLASAQEPDRLARPSSNLIYRAPSDESRSAAAPLVPVHPAQPTAEAASASGWKSAGAAPAASEPAVSIYQTPEVRAQLAQVQQMARPQPVQKSQQIILQWDQQAEAATGRAPLRTTPGAVPNAALHDGRVLR